MLVRRLRGLLSLLGAFATLELTCLKMKNTPAYFIVKLTTAVIYGFHNKLEYLSLNTRLSWKSLPGTNTLAYYGNHKLRP